MTGTTPTPDDDLMRHSAEWRAGQSHYGELWEMLTEEMQRQDEKHGPFTGTRLGATRLALACLEDEITEAKEAWRAERKKRDWLNTYGEVLQVAAVAMRALRDVFGEAVSR